MVAMVTMMNCFHDGKEKTLNIDIVLPASLQDGGGGGAVGSGGDSGSMSAMFYSSPISSLQRRSSDGVKPYPCLVAGCTSSFYYSHHLRRHERLTHKMKIIRRRPMTDEVKYMYGKALELTTLDDPRLSNTR